MEWENKNPNGLAGLRLAGLILLVIGVAVLVVAIALTMIASSALGPVLLVASILINTMAVIFLRKKN